MDEQSFIKQNIRDTVEKLGMKYGELAKRMGIASSSVSSILTRESGMTIEKLFNFASALCVPAYELLMTEEDKKRIGVHTGRFEGFCPHCGKKVILLATEEKKEPCEQNNGTEEHEGGKEGKSDIDIILGLAKGGWSAYQDIAVFKEVGKDESRLVGSCSKELFQKNGVVDLEAFRNCLDASVEHASGIENSIVKVVMAKKGEGREIFELRPEEV